MVVSAMAAGLLGCGNGSAIVRYAWRMNGFEFDMRLLGRW
jgi:hypothetical protein